MIAVSVIRHASVPARLTNREIRKIIRYVSRWERKRDAELSIVIVEDRKIRRINKEFLHHDYVTDVITFPLEEKKINAEIYINVQQAVRQAKKYCVTIKNEMTRLVVHGTLHAFGYDDTTKRERERMEKVQERYVSELS